MSLGLRQFQDGFADALGDPEAGRILPPEIRMVAAQPAFAVYRNTVMKGRVDALEANFPAVARLVGEEWFRAAARIYVGQRPPPLPIMSLYGEDFDRFLAGFEPARALPFLAPVARMDRMWSEAAAAADRHPLEPDMLRAPMAPERSRAILHPSARFAWFETTAPAIWLDARGYTAEAEQLSFEEQGEGLLLVRPRETVDAMALTAGGFAFLAACAARSTLAAAAAEAVDVEPGLDLAALVSGLLGIGAFTAIEA